MRTREKGKGPRCPSSLSFALRLPSSWNREKYKSVVCKAPSLWHFARAAQIDQDRASVCCSIKENDKNLPDNIMDDGFRPVATFPGLRMWGISNGQ